VPIAVILICMMTDLDYSVWKEMDGTRERWHWQAMEVDDDGNEDVFAGGIEDSKDQAMTKIRAAFRARKTK
jgi:hypothetical protein